MIAKLDIKMCPFRKEINLCGTETQNQYMALGSTYQENFLECIEENCMAWHNKECLAMRSPKEDKK